MNQVLVYSRSVPAGTIQTNHLYCYSFEGASDDESCYRVVCYRLVTLSGPILLHYRSICITLIVSCYIIGKFGVTLSVDVTLLGVATLSGITGLRS